MAPLTRVCLIGAESTGKSRLADDLSRLFSAAVVPEFAREYALAVGRPLEYADVEPIGRGQIDVEDRVIETASGLVILDTDLVSTVVYSRYYWRACPRWIERAAQRRVADLYLLLDADVPWIEDRARDATADRALVHAEFQRAVAEFRLRHVTIGGGWDERREKAIAAIQAAR